MFVCVYSHTNADALSTVQAARWVSMTFVKCWDQRFIAAEALHTYVASSDMQLAWKHLKHTV